MLTKAATVHLPPLRPRQEKPRQSVVPSAGYKLGDWQANPRS